MSDPNLQKLQSATVEPSLKNFHRGAVNSLGMLSLSFYGIIEAFQDEMEKSRGIQEKIEKSVDDVQNLQEELKTCNAKCVEMSNKLDIEMKKMRKNLSEQSIEIDNKMIKMKEYINEECAKTTQKCEDAIQKVSDKVGKSLGAVDQLQSDFENLEQETNDQIRSLSSRCEENKTLIEEQDNKFKDQLNEMTEILHNKALELDEKIQSCLNETTNKIEQFDAKQQEFQFEINNELSRKADVEDLKHKLDTSKYDEFMKNVYSNFANEIKENIKIIKEDVDNQQTKQQKQIDDITDIKNTENTRNEIINNKLKELESMISNPFDIESIKNDLNEQIVLQNENLRNELMSMIKSGPAALQPPSIGTQSGQCIACGRGPSNFQPLPVKSPSPTKKPKHGGGFNRLPTSSRRQSLNAYASAGKTIDKITSPKSAKAHRRKSLGYLADSNGKTNKKQIVENDAVKVQFDLGENDK